LLLAATVRRFARMPLGLFRSQHYEDIQLKSKSRVPFPLLNSYVFKIFMCPFDFVVEEAPENLQLEVIVFQTVRS